MENEPFDFRLLMKTPVSDMWVDAAAKGKLDLSKISQDGEARYRVQILKDY